MNIEDDGWEIWAATAWLMMMSRRWEQRLGGAQAAISLIKRSKGESIPNMLKEKLASEANMMTLSRDEEYRVRMLNGQLAALSKPSLNTLSTIIG